MHDTAGSVSVPFDVVSIHALHAERDRSKIVPVRIVFQSTRLFMWRDEIGSRYGN
jgi:hypothetical protein